MACSPQKSDGSGSARRRGTAHRGARRDRRQHQPRSRGLPAMAPQPIWSSPISGKAPISIPRLPLDPRTEPAALGFSNGTFNDPYRERSATKSNVRNSPNPVSRSQCTADIPTTAMHLAPDAAIGVFERPPSTLLTPAPELAGARNIEDARSESNRPIRICSPLTRQENQWLSEFAALFWVVASIQ